MSNGSLNPGKWDWSDPGTFMGMFSGALSGASMGSGIENSIIKQAHLNNIGNGGLKTTYAQNAYVHSLRAGPVYTDWKNAYADAYILNDPYGARRFGHNAILVGDEEAGYWYFSKDGINSTNKANYFRSYDDYLNSEIAKRYPRSYKIETTQLQDAKMMIKGHDIYNLPYHRTSNNCGDLVGDILNAGGFKGLNQGVTIPNTQYLEIQIKNPGVILKW